MSGRLSAVLAVALVVVAAGTYGLTHFLRLEDFPAYYLFDEAIQVCHAQDYLDRGFRGPDGERFPTFFPVAWDASISVSVYLQALALLLGGERSIWLSRFVAAAVGCLVPLSLAFILRSVFRVRWWWLGILVAAAIPTWFLHARTALVLPFMVAFYAVMIAGYLGYRVLSPWLIYVAVIGGGLAFYSYSSGQVVVPVTAGVLVAANLRYHLKTWRHSLAAALLAGLILVPAILFRLDHPSLLSDQLGYTGSALVSHESWLHRLGGVLANYGRPLSPLFWFFDSDELVRHRMLGYGHLATWMLPFFAVGLARAVWSVRDPRYQVVILALITTPAAGALSAPALGRVMAFIVPAALLVALGLNEVVELVHRRVTRPVAAIVVACGVAGYCGFMLDDALRRGPTWYTDYGLYGLQWGAKELFQGAIPAFLAAHPGAALSVSPDWANGADVFPRFFGSPPQVKMGGIREYVEQRYAEAVLPLPRNLVFVEPAEHLPSVLESGRFQTVDIVHTLFRPNGKPGFLFLEVSYVPDLAELIAREVAERREPEHATIRIGDLEGIPVVSSRADMGEIQSAFDDDPRSVVRGLEANPFTVELSLTGKRRLRGLEVLCSGETYEITAVVTGAGPDAGRVVERTALTVRQGLRSVGGLDLEPILVDTLRIEILDSGRGADEPTHVHLYDLKLLWEGAG